MTTTSSKDLQFLAYADLYSNGTLVTPMVFSKSSGWTKEGVAKWYCKFYKTERCTVISLINDATNYKVCTVEVEED